MAKKKIDGVVMSRDSFEDFLYMSYRYCIGRHTIHAACHADTIIRVIKSNPDCMSEERGQFTANDIRNEINNVIRWNDNIHIDGCTNVDVFTRILVESAKYDQPMKYTYRAYEDDIVAEPTANPKKIDEEFTDLFPWIIVANYLDKRTWKKVIVNLNGEEKEIISFQRPYRNSVGKYELAWVGVDCAEYRYTSINPDLIVRIEDI